MHWGSILIGWLVGSFFGLQQLLNLFKGVAGGARKG